MLNGKTFLAIIPARGGSKRLPRKNLLDLAGKPLITWTIEAALKSNYLDEVMVTTDDQEIADTAQHYGAAVPFLRPADLASDTATTFDVIKHSVDFYAAAGKTFDFVVLLQPTSPLRAAAHIDDALQLIESKKADAVISVTEMSHSPLWSNTLPANDDMSGFLRDEVKNKRSQDLETYYRLNGATYICRTNRLLEEKSFFIKENIFAYRMSKESSVDIDNKIDFDFAEFIMNTIFLENKDA